MHGIKLKAQLGPQGLVIFVIASAGKLLTGFLRKRLSTEDKHTMERLAMVTSIGTAALMGSLEVALGRAGVLVFMSHVS